MSGKWHRPNRFGPIFFKIMNLRELKFFEIKYIKERKHGKYHETDIIAKIRETRTRFLQPTHSECKV